ncbi:sporulation-induced protein [Coemansia sp. RSA 2531]|nr:sporulation-induced protein [Coemansia sp. RSA 2531]
MVEYIATEEFFKFSKMASTSCEVLCSNSMAFAETLVASYAARDFAESDGEEDEEESDDDDDDEYSPNTKRGQISSSSDSEVGSGPRQHLLELLWGIMRLPSGQVDALQATYFSRVMCSVLQRKPYETLDFVRAQGDAVPLFLAHLGVSAIVDLLLKVISLEELENGPGIIAWLSEYRLIPMLVDRLGPGCDPETHSLAAQVLLDIIAISQCNNPSQPTIGANALIEELKSEATVTRLANFMLDREAPHATSTLINCVYIFIELIRRNYSDSTTVTAGDSPISPDTDQQESPDQSSHGGGSTPRMPNVDLSDMMRVLAERTGDLVALLKDPRSPTAPVPTTQGMREPLGFERLRICELFAELLHCSNMPRLNQSVSSPLLESSPVSHRDSPTVAVATTSEGCATPHGSDIAEYAFGEGTVYSDVALVVSEAKDHDSSNTAVGQLLKWKLIEHGVLTTCVELFFEFGLNNFLHSVVYDIMHQVLNLPLSLECNVALIVVAFRDVRITSRIAQACANNDFVCRQPRGIRLGYMGHLTGIGEEVARLLELSGAALEPLIAPYIDGDEWLDYVARTLQEVRDRDQQPLGGERPGGNNNDIVGVLGDIDDSGVSELGGGNSNQVFVSRMGLVDPSSNESYGPEDDEDDDDDEEELDDDSEYSRRGFGGDRGYHTSTSMYPNEEDDESGIDYVNHSRLYFNPSVTRDDEDQFIIKDDDDDDDLADDTIDDSDNHARDIGPAERIGRYRSHQNELPLSTTGVDKKAAADPVVVVEEEDDDDDDGASEMGRMNDFLRNRAADLAEAARNNQSTTSGKKQYGRSLSNTTEEEEEGNLLSESVDTSFVEPDCGVEGRRQVIRLSFDGSADTVTGYDQTLLPSYLLSLSNHSNGPPPETPPRPTPQQTMAFVPPPLPNFLPPAISKLKAKQQQAAALNGGEPKGRLQDLLYRESKQRSLSSSELDNIVPADISSGSTAPITEDGDDRRGRSGSFAARRQRSRSQSAGVGISREMVIQAASQGQFPYLDANTCEFVGQLKSDTVKMGGAAANQSSGSRQRSNTAAGGSVVRGSVSSSPTVKPVRESNGMRACSLPQSGLRYLDDLSDDGDLDLSGVNIDDDGSVAMTVPDTLRIDTTTDDRRRNRRSKAIDALPGFPTLPLSPIHKSSPILQFSPPSTSPPA